MNKIRIAIAGAGLIGRQHIDRIRRADNCELIAIVDPSPHTAAYAAELDVPLYIDLHTLFASEKTDGIIVATPNAEHASNAIDCINRGIPILLEKPVADTLENAARIIEASERMNVPVLVGHHRRHSPILARAREIVRSGELGALAAVSALVTFLKPDPYFNIAWRRQPGGGPILINAIHAIDDLRYVCGEIESVKAMTSNVLRGFAVEDSAVAAFRFANGALGTLTLSDKASSPWSWELTSGENPAYPNLPEDCYFITGTRGSLAVPSLRQWRHENDDGWNSPLSMSRVICQRADPLVRQLAHFCDVIRGDALPIISARDAAQTLAATFAIQDAAQSPEHPIPRL